jgi:hypothetical protein
MEVLLIHSPKCQAHLQWTQKRKIKKPNKTKDEIKSEFQVKIKYYNSNMIFLGKWIENLPLLKPPPHSKAYLIPSFISPLFLIGFSLSLFSKMFL